MLGTNRLPAFLYLAGQLLVWSYVTCSVIRLKIPPWLVADVSCVYLDCVRGGCHVDDSGSRLNLTC